mgnify:CR=1 FL=1
MAFTTEELLNLGLTEEQAKSVFALRGKELNEDKSALETIKQERDSLKDQLQNAKSQLVEMQSDANTSEETKKALASLNKKRRLINYKLNMTSIKTKLLLNLRKLERLVLSI